MYLAEHGNVEAAGKACDIFKQSIEMNPDPLNLNFKEASKNLRDIAGLCLSYKFDTEKDDQEEEGIDILKYLVKKGDLASHLRLSHCYWVGTDYLKQDIEQSIALTQQAAEKGYQSAVDKLHWIGECFLRGEFGVEKDEQKASTMFLLVLLYQKSDSVLGRKNFTRELSAATVIEPMLPQTNMVDVAKPKTHK